MEEVEATFEQLGGEGDKVVCWRLEVLHSAGFPLDAAEMLAASAVDLHDTVDLLRRGCPPDLALRIVL